MLPNPLNKVQTEFGEGIEDRFPLNTGAKIRVRLDLKVRLLKNDRIEHLNRV